MAAVNAEHDRGQQLSSTAAAGRHNTTVGDNADRDYITIHDLLQDMHGHFVTANDLCMPLLTRK
jgi:hypothetical protein